jgi:hypothetical protein
VVGSEIGYIIGGGINICGLGAGHPKNPTCGLKDDSPCKFPPSESPSCLPSSGW